MVGGPEQHIATGTAELEKLAAELNGGDFAAAVVAHAGRRSCVRVRNRHAPVLTENIYADDESYWWGWAERISPVTDVAAAARIIMRVLRTAGAGR